MDTLTQALPLSVSPLILARDDLIALIMVVESYLESLLTPETSLEHAGKNSAALEKLHEIFVEMVDEERETVLFMAEPDVIALDEAVEGFTRTFEQRFITEENKQLVMGCLNQARAELANMKLAHARCRQDGRQIDGTNEHANRKSYYTQIQRGTTEDGQPVFQQCVTLQPGLLEWLQTHLEGGL